MFELIYSSSKIERHLKQYKIATMEDLKKVLGTDVRMTVYRKMKELQSLTSYSHRGKYYTLKNTPKFNETGLWSSKSVWFSLFGTLLETTKALVSSSKAGFTAMELEEIVHVSVKDSLMNLVERDSLYREQLSGVYVFFSSMNDVQVEQIINRKEQQKFLFSQPEMMEESIQDELQSARKLFFSLLDEKQKRLFSGLESMKLGHGGDQIIADLLGLNCHTVAKGRKEILSADLETNRVRKKGGGRSSVKKKP